MPTIYTSCVHILILVSVTLTVSSDHCEMKSAPQKDFCPNLPATDYTEVVCQNYDYSRFDLRQFLLFPKLSFYDSDLRRDFDKKILTHKMLLELHVQDSEININDVKDTTRLRKLKKLTLKHCQIKSVPGKTFQKMRALYHLDLSHNGIVDLEVDSFLGLFDTELPCRSVLILSHNRISQFEPGTFRHMKYLNSLHLQRNDIKFIISLNLLFLQVLDLSYNKITVVEDTILIYVKVANLSNNELKEIPSIKKWQNLKILKLDNNKLRKLDLHPKTKLNVLEINNNELESVNELIHDYWPKVLKANNNKIKNITLLSAARLETLELDNNRLEKVKITAPRLKILKLNRNSISDLALEVKQIENVEFSHNSMESLGTIDCKIKQLYYSRMHETKLGNIIRIDFSNCQVGRKLRNNQLHGMTTLKELYFGNVGLEIIEEGSFDDLKNVLIINLFNNKLDFVSCGNCWRGVDNLRQLDVSGNPIKLREGVFDGLSKLLILYVNSANLMDIPKGTFRNLDSLILLCLERNRLTTLPPLDQLQNLRKLSLSGNNLTISNMDSFNPIKPLKNLEWLEALENKWGPLSAKQIKNRSGSLIILEIEGLIDCEWHTKITQHRVCYLIDPSTVSNGKVKMLAKLESYVTSTFSHELYTASK